MSGSPVKKGAGDGDGSADGQEPPHLLNEAPTAQPRTSRNVSTATVPQHLSRSRRRSQDFSPTRNTALSSNLATMPSAAAVQRALSAQRTLVLPAGVDGVADSSRPDRSTLRSGPSSPAWPPPPSVRVKSPPPPPPQSRAGRKTDGEHSQSQSQTHQTATSTAAAVAVPVPSPISTAPIITTTTIPSTTPTSPPLKRQASAPPAPTAAENAGTASLRIPVRSATANTTTLETVAESSTALSDVLTRSVSLTPSHEAAEAELGRLEASTIKEGDLSGGEARKTVRAGSTARPQAALAKRSLTSLSAVKPKPPEPPRTMTVETEPVTSVPPLLVGDRGGSGRDGNGSIRTKGSNETIRPKKEKKKNTRKAPSLHSGPPSSKADLFEAKVASAVEEADTSDSDETFVYESNPPDSRTHRHHSRTPSANSLATGQDQYGRSRHGIRSGSHAIGGKKSMKFSNSAYHSHADDDKADSGHADASRRASQRHHHIGRYGKAAHASILEPNSPFNPGSGGGGGGGKPPGSPRNLTASAGGSGGGGTSGGRPSRPNSPRLANGRLGPAAAAAARTKPDTFDVYDDVADDERTPLVGSVRVNRSRHSRRPYGTGLRAAEYLEGGGDDGYDGGDDGDYDGRGGCWSRWAGCAAVTLVVVLLGSAVAAFVLGLSQPLLEVRVRHLQNILASEQELMLDLHVDAVNANLFVITVSDLDVNVFAESAYVGSSRQWEQQQQQQQQQQQRQHQHQRRLRWPKRRRPPAQSSSSAWPTLDLGHGVDPAWPDPPPGEEEPELPVQKMLLGRILEFDSPLTFEPSPIGRVSSSSVGEIRLPQPGNKTEVGGSERWERVLQHPFDLIVRGVLRYQLPLSSTTRSVKIASRAKIYPGDSDGGEGANEESNTTTRGRPSYPATS